MLIFNVKKKLHHAFTLKSLDRKLSCGVVLLTAVFPVCGRGSEDRGGSRKASRCHQEIEEEEEEDREEEDYEEDKEESECSSLPVEKQEENSPVSYLFVWRRNVSDLFSQKLTNDVLYVHDDIVLVVFL